MRGRWGRWWEDVRAAWGVWRVLRRFPGLPVHARIETDRRTQTHTTKC